MKILHVLETSIPNTVGYTVRADAIITHQKRLGLEPVVITSPFFATKDPSVKVEEIEGTRYYRTNDIPVPASAPNKLLSYLVRLRLLGRYRKAILDVVERERPQIIHAHSSYTNAYGALPASRRHGLPLIYEVRTLWGESAVIESGWRSGSLKHRMLWRLELGAMKRADVVAPIARGIRDELVQRGVPAEKMHIMPNGVDTAKFVPQPRNEALARSVGLEGRFVVGFIGSILRLEGLATLLEAMAICQRSSDRVALAIVGDGPERAALQARCAELKLDNVVFPGRVPHSEVAYWYSIMDVMVYPRIRAVINERVTPLKPLEAMAQGKVCIGSDVGGIQELIEDGRTGVIFRSEDPRNLADAILGLMADPARMNALREAALAYVRSERDWQAIGRRYLAMYEGLVAAR